MYIGNSTDEELFADSAAESCYVYRPPKTHHEERPRKRQKVAWSDSVKEPRFPQLFDGKEALESAVARATIFTAFWKIQEANLQNVLDEANSGTVNRICDFINKTIPMESPNQIHTGLITAGLATSSSGSMFAQVEQRVKVSKNVLVARISAVDCTNLKSSLKAILSNVSSWVDSEDEDDVLPNSGKGIRLLKYDLQILHNYVVDRSIEKTVLFFQNSEAIDGNVLSELIDVLSSWQDRIPFILLFETATSLDLFHEKLSRDATRRLRGSTFETRNATEVLDLLFRAATTPDASKSLWLGSAASKFLLDRQTEHIQSARGFLSAYKYMYMTHFFDNPLSAILSDIKPLALSEEHLAAIRALPSFNWTIQELTENKEKLRAQKLVKDDAYLRNDISDLLNYARESFHKLSNAIEVLSLMHSASPGKTNLTWSALYIRAMSGELVNSPIVRELSMSMRKLPSDALLTLLDNLSVIPSLDIKQEQKDLSTLVETAASSSDAPLRSEYDIHHETLRTTVIAQKVSLSKHRAALSKDDQEYSQLVDRFDAKLKDYFEENLVHPREICLSELLIFDSKGAYRQTLGPSPRQAIERALTNPHDYLNCECCDVEESRLSPTQPPTAILYQLYLESGAIINISDLWEAFKTILSSEEEPEDESKEAEVLALFYRGLAELKYLGLVKNSRKKTNHLTKLSWKGL